jgi:hypothetical protein
MNKPLEMTCLMQDFFAALPIDTKAFEKVAKNTTELGEKLTGVAFIAAEKSAEILNNWTKKTLAKLGDLSKTQNDPADYTTSLTDFASVQAEVAAENLAAFAEVAKKVKMETVEVMMAACNDVSADASAAMKTATSAAKSTPAAKPAAKAAK